MLPPIDLETERVAREFGLDPRLLQAVERAEGDLVRAVQCSLPSVSTREAALRVTARSAVHAMSDFLRQDPAAARMFVQLWARRWAPPGAANDPTHLNEHWATNVVQLWGV